MKEIDIINNLTTDYSLAFKELYQKYFKTVLFYILKNNGSKEDAEDIFQNTLLILRQNKVQLDITTLQWSDFSYFYNNQFFNS